MRLFKDVYKSANDDISPDPQLLESILNSKPKNKTRIYRYSTIAAACVVLVCAIAAYPKLETSLEQEAGIITENSYISDYSENVTANTATPPKATSEAKEASAPTAVPATLPPQENVQQKASNKAESSSVPTQQTTKHTALPHKNADIERIIEATQKETSDYQVASASIVDTAPITEAAAKETQAIEEIASESLQNSTTRKASGESPDDAVVPRTASLNDMSIATNNGMSAPNSLTQEEAVEIAENMFLEDFGEEFIKNTEVMVSGTQNYTITRFNDTVKKTITISLDGIVTKNY